MAEDCVGFVNQLFSPGCNPRSFMTSLIARASVVMIGSTRRNTTGGIVAQPGSRMRHSAEFTVDGVSVSSANRPTAILMLNLANHRNIAAVKAANLEAGTWRRPQYPR